MTKAEKIRELADAGKRPEEIAEAIGASLSGVYLLAKKHGIKWKYERRTTKGRINEEIKQRNELMRKYKAQGHTAKEVAEKFRTSHERARKICKGIAPRSQTCTIRDKEDRIREHFKKVPDIEYIKGYEGTGKLVEVRCKQCKAVFVISFQRIRAGTARCKNCMAEKAKESKKRKEEQRAEERRERKKERARREEQKKKEKEFRREQKKKSCIVCGAITTRPKYCSKECGKKAENKNREIARRKKIKEQLVDKDITLEALYKRDGGTCYICGMKCNYEDYVTRGKTFIAGDFYPSIDHVIPLSKMGKHSWKNVKLAHRRCNTAKAAGVYLPLR